MCGIAGLVARGRVDEAKLRLMTTALAHRGPDDSGIWIDSEAGLGFGHRRLAIVDLSPAGHQPMASRDGRWVLNYNGEIYNHSALRSELESAGGGPVAAGEAWRGHSDTETLLECIAAWGPERAIGRCVGMFAIALWDAKERRLHLIRDRFGEKPLYYGWTGGDFVFASELKAIRALPGFDNGLDRGALSRFTRFGYVPAPHSIFERIYKLEPGCILSATVAELRTPLARAPEPGSGPLRRYWSYRDVVAAGLADPIADEAEALDRLERALLDAVGDQAMADVPVGAFLSGGIDSSTVAALYRQHSKVRTFTIGFEEAAFDEAPYARAVAAHLGTDHEEVYVTARQAQEVIPLLPRIYDEPFADSSQIPTYLVCKHARAQVKVALSGDGGDEMFGGYNRYLAADRLWSKLNRLPSPLRAAVGAAAGRIPAAAWNAAADLAGRRSRQPHFGAKIRKSLRTMAAAAGIDQVHESFVDEWHGEEAPVTVAGFERGGEPAPLNGSAPDTVRMMYRDSVSYLPDDILCKVDRAAMAVSLETRLPLLDHRVAELAARIPVGMKIGGGAGKQLLRKLLFRHVPPALFERPKTGFAVPVGEWLRGPLRPWAEELLGESRLRAGGHFRPGPIRARWEDHLKGRGDSTASLWFVLMFQAWEAEGGGAAGRA
ncbi:MAG TPA: asparagine synthase (glutamine-hydrolyzing) [Allosphingosinicella sp.]|nr:asparagine synthase (glutamine-hydrolyzing) [Allosphingosinicella sp.]